MQHAIIIVRVADDESAVTVTRSALSLILAAAKIGLEGDDSADWYDEGTGDEAFAAVERLQRVL